MLRITGRFTSLTSKEKMSDRLLGMDRYDSPIPRRKPYGSSSDTALYSDERRHNTRNPQPSQTEQVKKLAGMALGTGSIWAFEIISHPFVVLRRSCQIYYPANRLHLTPVTLIPVVIKLNKNKPPICMWKGFVSNLLSRGINMISDNIVSESTSWPLQVSSYSTLKKHCFHLLLKGTGYLITTPFYVSSFVESVQSFGANDAPTLYEFFMEGCNRLLGRGVYQTAWLLPMYQLLIPTVMFRLSQYAIQSLACYAVMRAKSERQQESHDESSSVDGNVSTMSFYDQQFPGLLATFTGTFLADLVLYPFETVLHRLYVQGTRVLIDNTDTGLEVSGIQTQYDGVIDCFRSIIVEEGFMGLYQGFGAFVLQFSIHAAGLKIVQYLFDKISTDSQQFNLGYSASRRLSREFY